MRGGHQPKANGPMPPPPTPQEMGTSRFKGPDLVNHPPHYVTAAGIEAIDVIERYGLGESFHLANAMKYMLRAGRKGRAVEDLRKADWYLARFVSHDARASTCLDFKAAQQALKWATPCKVIAAFGITGAQAAAVRHLLDAVAFPHYDFGVPISIPLGLARVALGLAIEDLTRAPPRCSLVDAGA